MNNLRRRFERFCFRNRDKGIPNLMLYITLGNAIVLLLSLINGGSILFELLCFDKGKILQGQVWRLITFVFTQMTDGYWGLLFLYFFYMLGHHVEVTMGTLKFNLFYFCGVVLMDFFGMLFCPVFTADTAPSGDVMYQIGLLTEVLPRYWTMAYYLHLSLILTFATLHPDSHFMIFFIIPVKAWIIAIVYLVLEAIEIINLSTPTLFFPHNLFPLVALGNYLLFMWSDMKNLLPLSWRTKAGRKKAKPAKKTGTIPFPSAGSYQATVSAPTAAYNHRCTVCGRTDVSNPELEFRYCSRCKGYHCYCEDHISNHTHIEE